MAKGQRLKPEQIVTLLRQIDVLITNGKTYSRPVKKSAGREKLLSLAQDLWCYET